jgi:hypothetical protein
MKTLLPLDPTDGVYSVEFPVEDPNVPCRARVWHKALTYMCLIIPENPMVISRLRVGDTMSMRYYGDDLSYPCQDMKTVVRNITKNERGDLKGNYLVKLDILDMRDPSVEWLTPDP